MVSNKKRWCVPFCPVMDFHFMLLGRRRFADNVSWKHLWSIVVFKSHLMQCAVSTGSAFCTFWVPLHERIHHNYRGLALPLPTRGGSHCSRICIRFLENLSWLECQEPVQASWKPSNICPSIWNRVTLIDLSLKPTSYPEKKCLFDTLESLKGKSWWLVHCLAVWRGNVTFNSKPI